eukprot:349652-Pleurochrysis_carterae.AAC.2
MFSGALQLLRESLGDAAVGAVERQAPKTARLEVLNTARMVLNTAREPGAVVGAPKEPRGTARVGGKENEMPMRAAGAGMHRAEKATRGELARRGLAEKSAAASGVSSNIFGARAAQGTGVEQSASRACSSAGAWCAGSGA